MPPKKVPEHPDDSVLDLTAIHERLDQIARESQVQSQTRDDHVIALEHRFQGAEASITDLKVSVTGIHELLKTMSAKLAEKPVGFAHGDQSTHRFNQTGGGRDYTGRTDHSSGIEFTDQKVYMPRVDLPVFDGNRAASWLEHCKLYFEVNNTPEHYKTRLTTLSFTGDADEWWECYRVEHPNPSWPVLVEAVFERFKLRNNTNPVIQFKKVRQEGSVDDYVREFQRAKARLLAETGIKQEYFFVWSFICGLKEEIQNSIHLFKPQTLNDAFNLALELEISIGPGEKRPTFLRSQPTQNVRHHTFTTHKTPMFKPSETEPSIKKIGAQPTFNKPFLSTEPNSTLTIDQKRAMGLCFRCNDKWHQGHKCHKTLHSMEGEEEVNLDAQYQLEMTLSNEEDPEVEIEEEEVIIGTLSGTSRLGRKKTLQYKAKIGEFSICLLIDTGASHSFINPALAQNLNLPALPSKTLKVRSAGGEELISNTNCKNVRFSVQEFPFEADLWVMEVKGYDIILGIDWIADQDRIELMLKQGLVTVENKGKKVNLVTKVTDSEIQVLEGVVNVMREINEGSQVFYAQIAKVQEEKGDSTTTLHPSLIEILDQFSDIFAEPDSLPPHRAIDHQIVLKPNSKPINLRPYRFSFFQKTEIEKIIK